MFINIEDKMPHNDENNKKFGTTNTSNSSTPEQQNGLEFWDVSSVSSVDAELNKLNAAVHNNLVEDESTTVLGSAQSGNLSPTDGQSQRNLGPTWGNNNVEAGSNAGFHDNFAAGNHLRVTASNEPFGNVADIRRNVSVLRRFTPVATDPTRLVGFDSELRPYKSSHLNDEGYDSSPDYGDDLDPQSEAVDEKGRLPRIRQKGTKWLGIAGKSFSKLSSRD